MPGDATSIRTAQRVPPRRALAPLSALLLAVALLVALAGCSPGVPSEPPGITGSVTRLVAGDGRPASMLVEGGTQPSGALSDKAQVTIVPSTQFFGADGTAAKLSAVAGIKVGTKVRVWFEGAVAESYPIQGSAKAVQILAE